MAQAMSEGSFDTGMQKLTAMIFDFPPIFPAEKSVFLFISFSPFLII